MPPTPTARSLKTEDDGYTPPLGSGGSTADYDTAIRRWTREARWRGPALKALAPGPGETIIDIGCGTGTFAVAIKQAAPQTNVIAIDPDSEALRIAENKARERGITIDWRRGFARDCPALGVDAVTSSLMFHQVPMAEKRDALAAMFEALRPNGRLLIADYGLQRGLMRLLFRLAIQRIDGIIDTQPNADGVLPDLVADAGFIEIEGPAHVHTITGTIRLLTARRPVG